MNNIQHKEIQLWKTNHRNTQDAVESKSKQNNLNQNTINKGDTTMKHDTMFSRFGAAMVIALLISSVQFSVAAGTLAGTTITNQASVQYNAGSNVRNGLSNEATMVVGYKVSVNIFPSASNTTTVDSTILYKNFSVSNSGNYADFFQYRISNVPTGWTADLYKDKNSDGLWDGGDSLITGGGNGDSLYTTYDDSVHLILKIVIPQGSNAADNLSAAITVDVESDGSALGSIVRVGGVGTQTYTASVTISKPVLSFSVSPSYSANQIPGENQSYELTITNTGSAATNGNSTVTWKYDDANLENEVATGGSAVTGTATWTIASLAAVTGSATLTFTADIEQTSNNGTGVPVGTAITNGTSGSQVDYNDGLHSYSVNVSSTTSFNVGQASGAYVSQITANQSGNPGDSVTYEIRVRNRGNAKMKFTLSQAQNGGDLDTVHLFTQTSGASGSQPFVTDSIAAGDSLTVYTYLIVNVAGTDAETIVRDLTASPSVAGTAPNGAGNYNPTVTVTTTVTSPSLSIVLSQAHVYGVGNISNPAPGDTIEYTLTITNNGTGSATNLTTSNAIPSNTTFGTNSYGAGSGILVDGVAKTNSNGDADGANFNANTVSTGPFNVAGSGGTKIVKYKVAVN